MDYTNSRNVAKIIAFILVTIIFMEATAAAPAPSDYQISTTNHKNAKQNHRQNGNGRNGQKKEGHVKRLFDKETEKNWNNPCNSVDWIPGNSGSGQQNNSRSYDELSATIKLNVMDLKASFQTWTIINTSDVQSWEQFNNASFKFLPTRPTGIAQKWHEHTQIYVASFYLLYKYQNQSDNDNNNSTVSLELKQIFNRAQDLLCVIEDFVNATLQKKNESFKPYWFSKEEMSKLITLKKNKHFINNLFVKARFQHYIDRLFKRIQSFKLERNLKSLHRKGDKRRPSTPKTIILRTKNTKGPRKRKGTRKARKTTLNNQNL